MRQHRPRLPFRSSTEWHWRWLYLTARGTVLHRIAVLPGGLKRHKDNPHQMPGVSVCGLQGKWSMPGFPSRMGGNLCDRCRRKLGVKTAFGVPYNASEHEVGCERPRVERELRSK